MALGEMMSLTQGLAHGMVSIRTSYSFMIGVVVMIGRNQEGGNKGAPAIQ